MPGEQVALGTAEQVDSGSTGRRLVERLDPRITSIQPGGGWCMRAELAWGQVRRGLLKRFWPGFVSRMRAVRRGSVNVCPHEVLDPRDVKFYRNLGGYHWLPEDDPFAWRDRLPFVRVGLAELAIVGGLFLLLAVAMAPVLWPVSVLFALLGLEVVWFFRNPRRRIPLQPGLVVAPADGRIVAVEEEENRYVGGAALRIDIFLSVFNVHINRAPVAATVIGLSYRPGKFANALRASANRENEQLEMRLEERSAPYRPFVVRQIAGAIARRIVCWVGPGEVVARGDAFGMIKLGSRTELVLSREPGLEICVRVGQKVRAGETVLARYPEPADSPGDGTTTGAES